MKIVYNHGSIVSSIEDKTLIVDYSALSYIISNFKESSDFGSICLEYIVWGSFDMYRNADYSILNYDISIMNSYYEWCDKKDKQHITLLVKFNKVDKFK